MLIRSLLLTTAMRNVDKKNCYLKAKAYCCQDPEPGSDETLLYVHD
jgi:hypothetical protein